MLSLNNSPKACQICGSSALQYDEVFDGGRLILGECDRCQHRWTFSNRASPRVPVAPELIRMRRVSAAEVAMAS